MLKKVIAGMLGMVLLTTISGCAPKTESGNGSDSSAFANAGSGEKVLKVGMMGPFTGPGARVGDEFKAAAQMAFEAINYKVGDYKIEIVYIDDESDAEKATRAYERAITQDKIDVGFMDWNSWVSVACMEVAAKYKMPHFFSFGAGIEVNEKYQKDPEKYKYWVGKAWPTPSKLVDGYVETIEEAIQKGLWTPKNKNFAVFGVDQDWGRMFGSTVKESFEAKGWTCVDEEWVPIGETEYYPLLNKFKSKEVSLMVGTMSDAPASSSFIKQSKELNLPSMIIMDGLGWVGEWYELTGEASNYIIDQIPLYTSDKAKKFVEDFKTKFNMDPSPSTAGMCYDWTNYFIKVLQTTNETYGELTTENLMKCAEEQVMTGKLTYTDGVVHKEYKFTSENFPDMEVGQDYYMFPVIQYLDGKMHPVWPANQKEQDVVIPDYVK